MGAREYILKLYKIVSTDSILVIDRRGKIRRLYCPFKVKSKKPIGKLNGGEIVNVEAVKMTLNLKDVFIILGNAYRVKDFYILDR